MCSCCMSLVTVRLFATNLESKFELFQVFSLHITPYVSYLLFSQLFFLRYKLTKVNYNNPVIVLIEQGTEIVWFISTRIIL